MPTPQSAGAGELVAGRFFALRTPLLPLDELVEWAKGIEAPAAADDAGTLPDALARDRELLRGRLRRFVERREVREAIFVASPAIAELIPAWLGDPESPRGGQCERALVRYFARMTGRSTPFGLFAGVSKGTIADGTHLAVEGLAQSSRTTRLDAQYLLEVVDGLVAAPEVRETLSFRPNPSLYPAGERRRYVRSRPSADEHRHLLVSVRESRTLAETLAAAASGARPSTLVDGVVEGSADRERAARYVDELIDQQVLVPELDLQVTGSDAVYGLAETGPAAGVLAEARAALAALDAGGLGAPPERYRRIASILESLPAEPKLHRLLQVDLAKTSPEATLGRDVVDEILRGVEILRRMGRPPTGNALERFAERFTARYEGRAVPLLEALDPDLGIGFGDEAAAPAPLLVGLAPGDTRSPAATWGRQEEHLLARVLEVQAAGGVELVLGSRDLERLERRDAPPLPDAFAAVAILAARTQADLARGRFRVLVLGVDGPSGARLLGRFCHADPGLQTAVREHLRAEEALDPDAIYAEIVHLPRARDVNVVARPVLREYEIACLGRSGAPPQRQIPLDDLLVTVEDGQVLLRSRRLGRRVEPRLTSAHNFSFRGVAAYRFLCGIQNQGLGSLGFWGPLGGAPSLPRVRNGRVVLANACWRLDADSLGPKGDRASDYRAVQEWRRVWRVPRFVAQTDFGGQLPVDLDNVLAVESLADAVRSQGFADLVELFPPPGELCVRGPEGAFVHELVVPFVRAGKPPAGSRRSFAPEVRVRRTFAPGSEWLYTRLYTGETIADTVLTNAVAPLARELAGAGAADRWFFMRYADPDFHLRVRFHGEPARLHSEVLPAVQAVGQQLVGDGFVWRVEFGTYQREVERYGGPEGIELAEEVFHADSEAVIGILSLLEPGEPGQEERWRLGVAGTHRLLMDLELDEAERLALLRGQRERLARRLGWDGAALGRVGARFRRERTGLERLLDAKPGDRNALGPGLELLRERSARLAPIGKKLGRLDRAGRLTLPRSGVASSLLHMYLNRLLRGDNVPQELVICDFLARLYEGTARRRRAG